MRKYNTHKENKHIKISINVKMPTVFKPCSPTTMQYIHKGIAEIRISFYLKTSK